MKKLFTLLLVLIACSVSAIDMGPYDTGAARKSDLGTMAAEASTDYVATDTFTGHTGATGSSVHGLGTIATFASTDYVATSSLAERLDTGNASFSGDIDVTGDVGAATLGVTGHSTLTTASATAITISGTPIEIGSVASTGITVGYVTPPTTYFSVVANGLYSVRYLTTFIVRTSQGDAVLVLCNYLSATITILGSPNLITATSTPDSDKIGIYKSASSHVVYFKAGADWYGTIAISAFDYVSTPTYTAP
jgi:hypothetical protein